MRLKGSRLNANETEPETGLMVDDFGPHAERHGGRLAQIQGLGRRGGIRFVEAAAGAARSCGEKPTKPRELERTDRPVRPPRVGSVVRAAGVNKGGRPGLGKPWEALGISRAEYFRRRKAGRG